MATGVWTGWAAAPPGSWVTWTIGSRGFNCGGSPAPVLWPWHSNLTCGDVEVPVERWSSLLDCGCTGESRAHRNTVAQTLSACCRCSQHGERRVWKCTNLWLQRLCTVGERWNPRFWRTAWRRPAPRSIIIPILVGDGALEHWSLQRPPVLPGQVRPAIGSPTNGQHQPGQPPPLPRATFPLNQAVHGSEPSRAAQVVAPPVTGADRQARHRPSIRRLNLADPRNSKSSPSPSIITPPPPATAPTLGRQRQLPTRLSLSYTYTSTHYIHPTSSHTNLRAHCAPPTDARPADRSAPRGPIPPSPAASPSPSQPARDGRRHVLPTEVRRLATPPSQAIGSLKYCCMYTDARPCLARTQLAPAPLHPHQRLASLHLPLLRLHLLPQPALRLLLHPAAHPLPDLVQLVRPLLLRLSQRLVPPACLLFLFRRLLRLNLTCYADVHDIYRRRRRECYDIYPTPT